MRIAFIANGELSSSKPLLARIRACDAVVAVDGGINHCLRLGIAPELVIGDLDSASSEALSHFPDIKKHVYPRDKDQTDLEIALQQYPHADKLDIFGGLGHRIDHTLFNIHLLARYPGKASLISNAEEMFVIDKQARLDCPIGQTISLIPLNGAVTGIVSKGLKWELHQATLDKHFMGISNVALSERIDITIASGDLLCILTEESRERPLHTTALSR